MNLVQNNKCVAFADCHGKLLLQNCWPMKRCKPYFQLGILLKALTIANIWHSMSRIWTYTESEFICFLEWSCAVVIFITPWHHYRFVYVFISNFSTLNELKVTKNQKLIKKNPQLFSRFISNAEVEFIFQGLLIQMFDFSNLVYHIGFISFEWVVSRSFVYI